MTEFGGVIRRYSVPAAVLSELDVFRTGAEEAVRTTLVRRLGTDGFRLRANRIELELPDQSDVAPSRARLVWFKFPSAVIAAVPAGGSRAGRHAMPANSDETLCLLSVKQWKSGASHSTDVVTCRWCAVRLMAAEVATGRRVHPFALHGSQARPRRLSGGRPGRSARRRTIAIDAAAPTREGYEYWIAKQRVIAEQREYDLVTRFAAFLKTEGRAVEREALVAGQTEILYDLYDRSRSILFEAKADATSRPELRMAIGQLLDYGYFGFERDHRAVHKAILLPSEASEDVCNLLGYLGIGVAYERADRTFCEDYPWT